MSFIWLVANRVSNTTASDGHNSSAPGDHHHIPIAVLDRLIQA